MERLETFNSQESLKDKLIKSGIAKAALDTIYPGKEIDLALFDIAVAIEPENPLNGKKPVIIFKFPNAMGKVFVSENNYPKLAENLNEEQRNLLSELSEGAGDVWDEYDDETKKQIADRLQREVVELTKNQK